MTLLGLKIWIRINVFTEIIKAQILSSKQAGIKTFIRQLSKGLESCSGKKKRHLNTLRNAGLKRLRAQSTTEFAFCF